MKELFLIALLISSIELFPQSGFVSVGGDLSQGASQVSFSVGQVFYAPSHGNAATPGLQQSYTISTILDFDGSISVYPNPSIGTVTLKINNEEKEGFSFKVCDVQGHIIAEQLVQATETKVSLIDMANGICLFKVLHDNKEVKVFKIIKTQ